MRLLADENFPLASVQRLRTAGLDIAAIREITPGAADLAVLERAREEGRLLVTFDRDFGELVYRDRARTPPGILYLRLIPTSPEEPAQLLLDLFDIPDLRLTGFFTVVDRERVRQRPLLGLL